MPSFLTEISLEVHCECGEGLCLISDGVNEGKKVFEESYSTGPAIVVGRCPVCSKKKLPPKKERAK
jgi:hypothetical protein